MTRRSRREIEHALEEREGRGSPRDRDGLDVWVSWRDPEEERHDDGVVIDFNEVDT